MIDSRNFDWQSKRARPVLFTSQNVSFIISSVPVAKISRNDACSRPKPEIKQAFVLRKAVLQLQSTLHSIYL